MSKTKTHEEYVQEVKEVNPNIEVLEKYIGANKEIKHKCLICGNEWNVKPDTILHGFGCGKCAARSRGFKERKTHEQYITELALVNPNIEPLEEYQTNMTKILHKCKVDGYEWMTTPINLLAGRKCPVCSKPTRLTHEIYLAKLQANHIQVEPIESCINAHTKILHKCLRCGNEWMSTPNNILAKNGCPSCSSSMGEVRVREWLDGHNIRYEIQKRFDDCRDKKPLPFDFYLPDHNICIEYDGQQHFNPYAFHKDGAKEAEERFEITKIHDRIKNEYCKNKGIRLIRIPYNNSIKNQLDLLLA